MLRPGRELAIAHCTHLAAQSLHRDRDAELLPQPLAKIAQPPAHHAMRRRDRAAVDLRRQRLAVRVGEQGLGTRGLAVEQPVGPTGVEAQHPVPDDLQGEVAQQRRFRARAAIVDRGQRQQTTGLARVLAPPRQATKLRGVVVGAKGDSARHGEPPGITPYESRHLRVGESPA